MEKLNTNSFLPFDSFDVLLQARSRKGLLNRKNMLHFSNAVDELTLGIYKGRWKINWKLYLSQKSQACSFRIFKASPWKENGVEWMGRIMNISINFDKCARLASWNTLAASLIRRHHERWVGAFRMQRSNIVIEKFSASRRKMWFDGNCWRLKMGKHMNVVRLLMETSHNLWAVVNEIGALTTIGIFEWFGVIEEHFLNNQSNHLW